MARIIPPSATRPLLEEDGAPTDQSRDFFNNVANYSIEGDGSPVGTLSPRFIGQIYTDTTAADSYISVGLLNTDWKAIT